MAKLQSYKFVNPGGSLKSPVALAVKRNTLATNRLGATVSSLGSVVSDIEQIGIASIKNDKLRIQAERRREQRERDAAAEESQEVAKLQKKQKKPKLTSKLKRGAKGALGFIDKFLGPIGQFLLNIGAFFAITKTLEYVSDPANFEKIQTFLEKTDFVVRKIYGFLEPIVGATLDTFTTLFDGDATFGDRLKAVGKIMLGIYALKKVMNPFSLITDIVTLVQLMSVFNPFGRKPTVSSGTKPTGAKPKPTGAKPKPTVKPPRVPELTNDKVDPRPAPKGPPKKPKLSPFELEQARKQATLARTATKEITEEVGEKALTKQGSRIFGRGLDKATQRFFLKVAGKGGVKWLKSTFNRIPVIGPLLTFALNWASGESIAKSATMAVGAGLGELLGTWAGGALGALGGPFAPITIPLGSFVGNVLGSVAGEAIGGWLYDTIAGSQGGGIGAFGQALGKAIEGIFQKDWGAMAKGFLDWMGNTLMSVGQGIWGALNAMAEFMGAKNFFETLWKDMGELANGMKNVVKYLGDWRKWHMIVGELQKIAGKLFEFFVMPGPLGYIWNNAIMPFFGNISELWKNKDQLFDFLTRPGTFQETFGGQPLNFDESGKAVLDKDEPYFLGGIVKGIGKAIGGVAKGIGNFVGGAVKAVGNVISNPIVGTALSFIPGMQIPMAIANGVVGIANGNPLQAASGLLGGIGQFANINTVNAINNPTWLNNLRFSGFGQGVANLYHSGASFLGNNPWIGNVANNLFSGNIAGAASAGLGAINPALGNIATSLFGGDLRGAALTGLGMIPGGDRFSGIAGSLFDGDFLGAGSQGLSMLNPQLGDLFGSITGGGLNPKSMLGGLADHFGLGGVMDAVTGMFSGGDTITSLKTIASELGVDPKIIGAVDAGKKMLSGVDNFSAQYAMEQAMEFIPVPIILEKIIPMPQAVPLNTGTDIVSPTPSSLGGRMG